MVSPPVNDLLVIQPKSGGATELHEFWVAGCTGASVCEHFQTQTAVLSTVQQHSLSLAVRIRINFPLTSILFGYN